MKVYCLAFALGLAISSSAVQTSDEEFKRQLEAATRDVAKLGDSLNLIESNSATHRRTHHRRSRETAAGRKAIPGMVAPKIVNYDAVQQAQMPEGRITHAVHARSTEPIWAPGTRASNGATYDSGSSEDGDSASDSDHEAEVAAGDKGVQPLAPGSAEADTGGDSAVPPGGLTRQDLNDMEASIVDKVLSRLTAERAQAQPEEPKEASNEAADEEAEEAEPTQKASDTQEGADDDEDATTTQEPQHTQHTQKQPIPDASANTAKAAQHSSDYPHIEDHALQHEDGLSSASQHPPVEDHDDTMRYIENELDEIARVEGGLLHKTTAIEEAVAILAKIALENHQHDAGARDLIRELQKSLHKLSTSHARLGMLDAIDHLGQETAGEQHSSSSAQQHNRRQQTTRHQPIDYQHSSDFHSDYQQQE